MMYHHRLQEIYSQNSLSIVIAQLRIQIQTLTVTFCLCSPSYSTDIGSNRPEIPSCDNQIMDSCRHGSKLPQRIRPQQTRDFRLVKVLCIGNRPESVQRNIWVVQVKHSSFAKRIDKGKSLHILNNINTVQNMCYCFISGDKLKKTSHCSTSQKPEVNQSGRILSLHQQGQLLAKLRLYLYWWVLDYKVPTSHAAGVLDFNNSSSFNIRNPNS